MQTASLGKPWYPKEFDSTGEPWNTNEDKQLHTEYTIDKLNLLEISSSHLRKPGEIIGRLKYLNVIYKIEDTRGFSEFLDSGLYKEILKKRGETNVDSKIEKMKEIITPVRKGAKWEDEEVLKLLTAIQKKKPINEIAKLHDRTEGGILARLKEIAVDYYMYDKRPMEQIIKFTGLTENVINEAIQKRQYRDSLKGKKNATPVTNTLVLKKTDDEPSLHDIMKALKDLQQKMDVLLSITQ